MFLYEVLFVYNVGGLGLHFGSMLSSFGDLGPSFGVLFGYFSGCFSRSNKQGMRQTRSANIQDPGPTREHLNKAKGHQLRTRNQ